MNRKKWKVKIVIEKIKNFFEKNIKLRNEEKWKE